MTLLKHLLGRAVPASLALLCACGPSGPSGIDEPRELEELRMPPPLDTTHGQRFGIDAGRNSEPPTPAPSSGAPTAFPTDWEELPSTQFRAINLRPAGDPEMECYVTVLGGDGGGNLANVNRWRGQMGLPPIDQQGLGQLEQVNFLGVPAIFVDLEGSFSGMGGAAKSGWRMLVLLASVPGQSISLKMTGPTTKIAAQVDNFFAVAEEITEAQRRPSDNPGSGQAPGQGASSTAGGGLTWDTPEGWTEGAARTMRLASFVPNAAPQIDISVTQLAGPAGGPQANFDRWRGQMGQAPLTSAEFSDLERIPALGTEALMIEIDGRFTGMGNADQQDARMLGAIVPNGSGTLFVKLTGPRDAVAAETAAFRAFLASLRRSTP